jgi:hypothetical protein
MAGRGAIAVDTGGPPPAGAGVMAVPGHRVFGSLREMLQAGAADHRILMGEYADGRTRFPDAVPGPYTVCAVARGAAAAAFGPCAPVDVAAGRISEIALTPW